MFRATFLFTLKLQVYTMRYVMYIIGLTVLCFLNVLQHNDDLRQSTANRATSQPARLELNGLITTTIALPPHSNSFVAAYPVTVFPEILHIDHDFIQGTAGSQNSIANLGDPYTIDWIFIVGVWGSLGAIALTFDSINAHKRNKSLALIVSQVHRRATYFSAQIVANWALVFIPFAACAAISVIVITILHTIGNLDSQLDSISCVFLVLVPAALYLAGFALLGTIMSCVCAQPKSSLLYCLGVWMLFVWIWPIMAFLAADVIMPVPTYREASAAWLEYERKGNASVSSNILAPIVESNGSHEEKLRRIRETAARIEQEIEQERRMAEKEIRRLKREYDRERVRQYEFGLLLSKLSPYEHWSSICNGLAVAGWYRYCCLMEQGQRYARDYAATASAIMRDCDTLATFSSTASATYGDYSISIRGGKRFDRIDASSFRLPSFYWEQPGLGQRVVACWPEFSVLLLSIGLLWLVAVLYFERLDLT